MSEPLTENRLLHFPAGFFAALHRALAHELPTARAATLMRRVGFEAGEDVWNALGEWVARQNGPGADPRSLPAEEFWRDLGGFFDTLGWGTLRHTPLHPGVAALESEDWVEAGPADGDTDHPGCQLSTGLFAELLRRLAGADVAVLEVQCRGRGDERCRFLLGNPATLEAVYGELVAGSAVPDALTALG